MKNFIQCAFFSTAMIASAVAHAHNLWLLPSETNKAGKGGWVTFDLAASENLFSFESGAPKISAPQVVAPDASITEVQNVFEGKLRTSFDVEIAQPGTYKVFVASSGLSARWETPEGKRGFWPERGVKANPADFATAVPKDAKNLEVTQGSRRIETFVTLGKTTTQAFAPTNEGLELVPITHPNDLAVSEPAEFKFLMDGKPAAGVKVSVIAGGSRYRNSPEELELETDKNGLVKVKWKQMGTYWLGASYRDEKAKKPAKFRSGNYSATFEVLVE